MIAMEAQAEAQTEELRRQIEETARVIAEMRRA